MEFASSDRLNRLWPQEFAALPAASFLHRESGNEHLQKPVHVMISHSSKDRAIGEATCAYLESQGLRCWIAPRDILPGEEWGAAILHGISAARVFVLIYSANSNESIQVRREVERAVSRKLFVIPFRVQDVPMSPTLEYFISTPHWLDALHPPLGQHLERLAASIRALLGLSGAARHVPIAGPARVEMPPRVRPRMSLNVLCLLGAALVGQAFWPIAAKPKNFPTPRRDYPNRAT